MTQATRHLVAGFLALSLSGCFFESDDETGSTRPAACDAIAAARYELVVYDSFGDFYTEAEAPCEAFALSLELSDGFYSADATLVDFADRAVTTTSTLEALDIIADSELVVTVDFPPGSVL
jgi:hypothetical protein